MSKQYNTSEEMKRVASVGMEKMKELGVNIKEDDFTIVQTYTNGQAIIVNVEDNEEGKRGIKYNVSDSVIVLDPISDGSLDIFGESHE